MKSYPQEAIDFCFQLYLRHHGQHDVIELEMRKKYPKWSRSNLYDTKRRFGWVTRFGWEDALKAQIEIKMKASLTGDEALYHDIRSTRERYSKAIQSGKADGKVPYLHRDYCQLEIDALARLKAARNRFADFSVFWEDLMRGLPNISRNAFRELVDCSDEILKWAEAEYGAKIS